MYRNRKSNRSISRGASRRRALAAILLTCGTACTVLADEDRTGAKVRPSILPPLPVGIEQMRDPGSPRIISSVTPNEVNPVRTNPYANSSSASGVRRVAGTESNAATHQSSTFSLRPIATAEHQQSIPGSTATIVTAWMPTTDQVAENFEGSADNLSHSRDSGAQFAVAGVGGATAPIPSAETQGPPVAARTNPWVAGDPQAATSDQTVSMAVDTEFDIPADRTAAEFRLSDSDSTPLRFSDEGETVRLDVAPLLAVPPPSLLRAAQPVAFDDLPPSNEAARHGDVRSTVVSRTDKPSNDSPSSADDVEPIVSDHAQVAASDLANSESDAPELSTGGLRPVKIDPVAEISESYANSQPNQAGGASQELSKTELPVPQVYRPKQSLVIDVPDAKQAVNAVAQTNANVPEDDIPREQIFVGAVSDVVTITKAQSHAFAPSAPVRRVQLEDRDICEAVLVGTHKLLLIGRSEGATRLAIWCGDQAEPQLYEVRIVATGDTTPGSSLPAIAKRLTETISVTYPNCRVQVVPHDDGLAVLGSAADRRSAREILRLVRSACLKSVSDQLEVR
jgi:hypothetical protein